MSKNYDKPSVQDHGTLQELTAACPGGSGGDAFTAAGAYGGLTFGTSNPAFGCSSSS
jgi:hypothetical protein